MSEWMDKLQEWSQQLDHVERYRVILDMLDKYPDGLSEDELSATKQLTERFTKSQNLERQRRYDLAMKAWKNLDNDLDMVLKTFLDATAHYLHRDNLPVSEEIDSRYQSLSRADWDEQKSRRYIDHVKYRLDNDYVMTISIKKTVEWCKKQRNNLENREISDVIPEAKELLGRIKKELNELEKSETIIDSRHLTKDYVKVMRGLEGRTDEETKAELAQYRKEYTEYVMSVGVSKFEQVTGAHFSQWSVNNPQYNPDIDFGQIEIELRVGILNMRPSFRSQPEYQNAPALEGDRSIDPEAFWLGTDAVEKRQDFELLLQTLQAALRKFMSYRKIWEAHPRLLRDVLMSKIHIHYPRQEITNWVNDRLEPLITQVEQNYEIESSRGYSHINENTLRTIESEIENSDLSVDNLPATIKTRIDELRVKIVRLKVDLRAFQSNENVVKDAVTKLENALNGDGDVQDAYYEFEDVYRRIPTEQQSQLTTSITTRIKTAQARYSERASVGDIITKLESLYKIAQKTPDIIQTWEEIKQLGESKFASNSTSDPIIIKGKQIYLHALARVAVLTVKDLPNENADIEAQVEKVKLALRELSNMLRFNDAQLPDLEILEQMITSKEENIGQYNRNNVGIVALRQQIQAYLNADYTQSDHIGAYEHYIHSDVVSEDEKEARINDIIFKRWIDDTEKAIESLRTSYMQNQQLDMTLLDAVMRNSEALKSAGRPIRFDLSVWMEKRRNEFKLLQFRKKHSNNAQTRSEAVPIVLTAGEYQEWVSIDSLSQNEKQEVQAYLHLCQLWDANEDNVDQFSEKLAQFIAKAGDNVARYILIDALLQAYMYRLFQPGADAKKIMFDVLSALKQLLEQAKTDAVIDAHLLWLYRADAQKTFLDGNYSETLKKLNDIDRHTLQQSVEPTSWVTNRHTEMKKFTEETRNRIYAQCNSLLAEYNAVADPALLTRLLEYVSILLEKNRNHSIAQTRQSSILVQVNLIINYLGSQPNDIVNRVFPRSVADAKSEMGNLIGQIESIMKSLNATDQVPFKRALSNVRTYSQAISNADDAYEKARKRLLDMLMNTPGANTPTDWNVGAANAEISKAIGAFGEVTALGGFQGATQLDTLTTLYEDIQKLLVGINKYKLDIHAIFKASIPDNMLHSTRYENGIKSLEMIQNSVKGIVALIDQNRDTVFANLNVGTFSIPKAFITLSLNTVPMAFTILADDGQKMLAITSVEEFEKAFLYLKRESKSWEEWIEKFDKYYNAYTDYSQEINEWLSYITTLNSAVFDANTHDDMPQAELDTTGKQRLFLDFNDALFKYNPGTPPQGGYDFDKLPSLIKAVLSHEMKEKPPADTIPAYFHGYYKAKLGRILGALGVPMGMMTITPLMNAVQGEVKKLHDQAIELETYYELYKGYISRIDDELESLEPVQRAWLNRPNKEERIMRENRKNFLKVIKKKPRGEGQI